MALFNRQKNSTVPPELQPYYDAPRSGPRGWLLWIVRILALLIVLALLFVTGRWACQKIDKNDKKVGTTQSINERAGDNKNNSNNNSDTDNKGGTVNTNDESAGNQSTSNPAPSTPAPSSTQGSSSTAAPSSLANTGPGENILLFSVATASGIVAYQIFIRRKKSV